MKVTRSVKTLYDVRFHPHIRATNGAPGGTNNKYGRDGKDFELSVPPGTMIYTEDGELIADLVEEDDFFVAAVGGRGGRGNAVFLSNTNRAPYIRELGEPGEDRTLILELKLIADVGLVGLPNAGKSTLLSVLSNAKPKIASYPFTTIEPNLGAIISERGFSFVIADLPGLIEGASRGIGLGDKFLKHAERTRLLVHLVDMAGTEGRDPADDYRTIRKELESYGDILASKPVMVVANKMDVPEAQLFLEEFKKNTGIDPIGISAAGRLNITVLKSAVAERLEELPPAETQLPERHEFEEDRRKFTIEIIDGDYHVNGVYINKIASMTDFSLPESVRRCTDIMKKLGIFEKLAEMEAEDGDSVVVADKFEFFYRRD